MPNPTGAVALVQKNHPCAFDPLAPLVLAWPLDLRRDIVRLVGQVDAKRG